MSMRKYRLSLQLLLILQVFSMAATAAPLKLYVPYPAGWQLREPLLRDNMLAYEARQRVGDKVVQHLQIAAISPPVGKPAPSSESLKQLAGNLRDFSLKTAKEKEIPLQKFATAQGYFYSTTDKNPKPGEFTQMVEGVMLNQGYLINFTLLTNDAAGADAQAMVSVLDKLSIR